MFILTSSLPLVVQYKINLVLALAIALDRYQVYEQYDYVYIDSIYKWTDIKAGLEVRIGEKFFGIGTGG